MGFRNGKSLQWWNPSLDETIAHMRYAYEHPREVEAKGKKAQRFVRKAFAEETIAKQLLDVLNIYAVVRIPHNSRGPLDDYDVSDPLPDQKYNFRPGSCLRRPFLTAS